MDMFRPDVKTLSVARETCWQKMCVFACSAHVCKNVPRNSQSNEQNNLIRGRCERLNL